MAQCSGVSPEPCRVYNKAKPVWIETTGGRSVCIGALHVDVTRTVGTSEPFGPLTQAARAASPRNRSLRALNPQRSPQRSYAARIAREIRKRCT